MVVFRGGGCEIIYGGGGGDGGADLERVGMNSGLWLFFCQGTPGSNLFIYHNGGGNGSRIRFQLFDVIDGKHIDSFPPCLPLHNAARVELGW